MKYPYEMETILRVDYQKWRPIRLDKLDKEMEREAEMVKRMRNFRSAFNPTCKNSNQGYNLYYWEVSHYSARSLRMPYKHLWLNQGPVQRLFQLKRAELSKVIRNSFTHLDKII